MLKDIVEVRALENYRLYIRFEDNVQGEINIAELITFDGIFTALQDERNFKQAVVNSELGTVCWPNGADLDPQVLYAKLTGQPITTRLPERRSKPVVP